MRKLIPAVLAGAVLIGSCTASTVDESNSNIPTHLGMNVQPSVVDIGSVMAPSLKVEVRNALGNVVDSTGDLTVTVSVTPGSGSALGQNVSGTTTRAVVNGVATFNDLSFSTEGTGFTLTFTSSGLVDAVSSPFDVTNNANYLYFSSDRTGAFEVWRMKPDGSQQSQVTSRSMLSDPFPAKSSSNSRVAFSDGAYGRQTLWAMNADGSSQQQLTTLSDAAQASWAHDGINLAARVAAGAPSFGLFVMRADGSNRQQLSGGVEDFPSWSPASDQIAFNLDYTEVRRMPSTGGADTKVIFVDTTNTLVTFVKDTFAAFLSDTGFIPFTYDSTFIGQTAWSPDGMRIAFVLQAFGKRHIFAISNLGAGVVAVLTNKATANDDSPTWSPDGTKIFFQSDRAVPGVYQIWSMNQDGSGLTQLTTTGNNTSPSWWN